MTPKPEENDPASSSHLEAPQSFEEEVQEALSQLQKTYGTKELTKPEMVLLMDGWNKILGWETMWKGEKKYGE